MDTTSEILTQPQRNALRNALQSRRTALCFGAGVDSTAMLVALRCAGLRPDVITFADTGGEKPETYAHLQAIQPVLANWGWPPVDIVRKVPLAATAYYDLYGNCVANQTLPSLAFGMKACSIKWKQGPQDQFLKGVKSGQNARPPHPLWEAAQAASDRIVKLIGYDCGRADQRRSGRLAHADSDFDFVYPLQLIGWTRHECVQAITSVLGPDRVPVKSACFFCPASKKWELFWLAAHHPELLERALALEWGALTGRHSRFDEVAFDASWEQLVQSEGGFPSARTTVGLGRGFAWNHWARRHNVLDASARVHRDPVSKARFLAEAEQLRDADNALDVRGAGALEPKAAQRVMPAAPASAEIAAA